MLQNDMSQNDICHKMTSVATSWMIEYYGCTGRRNIFFI